MLCYDFGFIQAAMKSAIVKVKVKWSENPTLPSFHLKTNICTQNSRAFCCWNLGLNLSYSPPSEICSKIGNATTSSIIFTAREKELSSAIILKDQIITKTVHQRSWHLVVIFFCRCWKDAIKLFEKLNTGVWRAALRSNKCGFSSWHVQQNHFQLLISNKKKCIFHTFKIYTFEPWSNKRLNKLK